MDEKNEFIVSVISKEIKKGWNLILPDHCVDIISDLVLNLMEVATNLGITETENFEPKNQVTQDLSFLGKFSGESINSRVKVDCLEPCMFSYIFLRIIHYIVSFL